MIQQSDCDCDCDCVASLSCYLLPFIIAQFEKTAASCTTVIAFRPMDKTHLLNGVLNTMRGREMCKEQWLSLQSL
jgi:hypothetical protein